MTNQAANGSGSPNASRNDVIRRGAFAACLLLYVWSLCVPAVHYNNHYLVYGWVAAAFGWSPAFPLQLLWIANLLMWVGIICFLYRGFRVATCLSSLAILSALTFLFNRSLSANSQIFGGYYLWVGSMVVLLVGSIYCIKSAGDHAITLTAPPHWTTKGTFARVVHWITVAILSALGLIIGAFIISKLFGLQLVNSFIES